MAVTTVHRAGVAGVVGGSHSTLPGFKTPTRSPYRRTHITHSIVSATERCLKWPLQRRMTW